MYMLIWFKGLQLAVTSYDVIKVSLQYTQGFSQIVEKVTIVVQLLLLGFHWGHLSALLPASWCLISGSHVQIKMNHGTSGLFALDLFSTPL